MRRVFLITALLTSSWAAAGCQQSDNQLPGVIATAVPMTETFSGNVAVGGLDFKNFTVTISGTVSITVTTIAPNPLTIVELGVGTPSTTTCALAAAGTVSAGTTPQFSQPIVAGQYCVQVRDLQNAGPLTYSVTVVHP